MRGITYLIRRQDNTHFALGCVPASSPFPVRKMEGGCGNGVPGRVLVAGLVLFLLSGCAGLWKRSPSERELVAQVMQRWAEGWANLDADLLEPLISEAYYGANGESKNELLDAIRKSKGNPENRVTFSLNEMVIQVEGGQATVRGVRADVNVKEWDSVGEYKLDYFLRNENGIWRITGAALAS